MFLLLLILFVLLYLLFHTIGSLLFSFLDSEADKKMIHDYKDL